MPSNIDKAFIDNLQNFTDSLEGIVELLKSQSKKGDAVNQMLASMDGQKISDIADDIKALVSKTDKIDTTTKKILEEVKASRKSKESGMFGQVSDTKNKNKIVDGIGVIMLIAGGVLAIGMAFKLVGKIDVMSAIALSIAIYLVSKSFAEIAKLKELTLKKTIVTGLVMITIAGALVVSGYILKKMPSIDIFTAFSMILVGGALGVAAFLLLSAVSKMILTPKTIASIFLLPLILPAIALGIVASSFIMKGMQTIDIKKGISFALLGGALGLAAFLLLRAVSKIDVSKNMKDLLLLPLILPVITGAIVASALIINKLFKPLEEPGKFITSALAIGLGIVSFVPVLWAIDKFKINLDKALLGGLVVVILSAAIISSLLLLRLFKPLEDPGKFIISAGAIGLGILAFIPVLWAVDKFKLDPAKALMGGLVVVIAATAIMLSSWILSIGNYKKYPDVKWALGVGLALILFTPPLILFGILAMSGIGLAALALGAIGALIVAATIVAVSHVIGLGSYKEGPPLSWAVGMGILLPVFGASMVMLALIPFAGKLLKRGGEMVLDVAMTMALVSYILKAGSYTGGPTKEWAEGIGLSLGSFSNALGVALKGGGGLFSKGLAPGEFVDFIRNVSYGMIEAADILSQGNWGQNAPSKQWGEGVGAALSPFIDIFSMLATSPKAKAIMKDMKKSKKKGEDSIFVDFMKDVAWGMVSVNRIFGQTDWKNYPSKEWGNGVKDAFDVLSVIGDTDSKIIKGINNFADAITTLTKSFNGLRSAGIDKFGRLTGSITILSDVDQNQLNNVLGVLDANKEKLADVTRAAGRGSVGVPQGVRNVQEKVQTALTKTKKDELSTGEKMMSDKFDQVLEKFDDVLDTMTKAGLGKDAGGKDDVKGNKWG